MTPNSVIDIELPIKWDEEEIKDKQQNGIVYFYVGWDGASSQDFDCSQALGAAQNTRGGKEVSMLLIL